MPIRDFAPGFKDGLYVNTSIRFGWIDSIRILLGYKVELRTLTYCENPPGKTASGENRLLVYSDHPLMRGRGEVEVCAEAKHETTN